MEQKKSKTIMKSIISNFLVFLFCIAFIQGFVALFGAENSSSGVVVLTGSLIFLKADLGLERKQGSAVLFLLFAIIAAAPKFSLVNPYLGVVINFSSIFLILVLSTYQYKLENHITFLLGYIFCQGYDVTNHVYVSRAAGLVLGGLLVAVVYAVTHKNSESRTTLKDAIKGVSLKNERTQWQLKLTCALTIVMFLGQITQFPRTMWISFSVLSLIHPDRETGKLRLRNRIPATLIGALVFFVLFYYVVPEDKVQIVSLLLGFVVMFAKDYLPRTILNTLNALIAANVLFSVQEAVYLRVLANLLGFVFLIMYLPIYHGIMKKRYPMEAVE